MSDLSKRALFWAPRVLSIAFVAFLSLFAMDVLEEHLGFWMTIEALTMHLIPCIVLVAVLILAWRREWIGAVLYAIAGAVYAIWAVSGPRAVPLVTRLVWILVIAGPAFLIAFLFLLNWRKHEELHTLLH
jgi:hypothetical protein